jgi:hypothetical protein
MNKSFFTLLAIRPLKIISSDVELSFKGKTTKNAQQGKHVL